MPTITYLVDGAVYSEMTLEPGATVEPPAAPEQEGRTFCGWRGLPAVMPDAPVTVEAELCSATYTLTQIVDGEVWQTLSLAPGTSLTELPLPQREGYAFCGWTKKHKTMPRKCLTLHGSFRPNRYRLVLEIEGITFERTVEFGAPLDFVLTPERDNHTFSGWQGLPATMPARDLHLTGTFSLDTYTLTYLLDGEELQREVLPVGAPITPPAMSPREGYTFSGWRGLPRTMPACDVTIAGKYHRRKSKITFLVDGKKYAWVHLPEGDPVVPPDPPKKSGYTFLGWKDLPAVTPVSDLTVEAEFAPKDA
ncbi:MAG: InlB B-repeat-containing protein [Clostridia bacterium]|nr:InlB B-repeat-containing protein [Clostridia bacterium]